uniref:Survival protein SurE-like phosphatase/nucleotidase domain-containing protein n=1 Tax=Fagus sylvatica TaxID=28930 RepID=A0A2N9HJ40_FAGSY
MTSTSEKNNNLLPPGLVSNLQQVLSKKNNNDNNDSEAESKESDNAEPSSSTSVSDASEAIDTSKPIVLVTNGDGIESLGLVYLVEALVREGLYNVHVCAPQSWV